MILRTRPYSHSDSFARYFPTILIAINTKDIEQLFFSRLTRCHSARLHYKTVHIFYYTDCLLAACDFRRVNETTGLTDTYSYFFIIIIQRHRVTRFHHHTVVPAMHSLHQFQSLVRVLPFFPLLTV